ncbi:MAG TPA: neutral/alkaline non-lysosomal ceramidase N-terminal domain-containing protein [Polyangiales bacterium]
MRWFALTLALCGCSYHYMPAAASVQAAFKPSAEIEVGVGRADITPPPGVSTFGHGPDARVTNGVWTRLYCRAFVFKQGSAALAIVPCDLSAISTLLQRRVAEQLALRSVPIEAPRLMLTATHTHAGPAHYFDGKDYAGLGSSQLPGYDDAMVDFLAKRIAAAVADACAAAKPAELRWARDTIPDLTRNRDLPAFVKNAAPPWAAPCPEGPPEYCAIDPALAVLEIRDKVTTCALGELGFFAMHPTVLPNTNQLLGADAFGVASRVREAELRAGNAACSNSDPLSGLVNTNEGDIVARWSSGTVQEAISIGTRLAGHVREALTKAAAAPAEPALELASRYVEVDLPGNHFGLSGPGLCEAELGSLASLGATDHPTFLNATRGEGSPRKWWRTDCQGPKLDAPWPVGGALRGPQSFTSVVPIAVVRIGDQLISFLPAELTVASGRLVNNAVLQSAAGHAANMHALVAGLANGYIQYVASPDEYDAQGYEGASTLFGPRSAPVLAKIAGALTSSLYTHTELPGKPDEATRFQYWLGPTRARFPRQTQEPSLAELGAQRRALQTCAVAGAEPHAVCFFWIDGAPGEVGIERAPWLGVVALAPPSPLPAALPAQLPSALLGAYSPSIVLDDRSFAFRTRIHHAMGDAWEWSSLLQATPEQWAALADWGTLQLRVGLGTKHELKSQSWSASTPLPLCTTEEARRCGY